MKSSLDTLLEELLNSAQAPPPVSLYHFSGLDADETARVRELWPRLPVELRREIVKRLAELAEADFEMNFGAVFRLGLEDVDAEVRTRAVEGLWEDQDTRLVAPLATCLLEDVAPAVRAAAATSLGRFVLLGELQKIRPGPHAQAYQALLAACQAVEEAPEVKRRALESIAYTDNDVVTEMIRQAYESADEKLRVSAVFAMGRSVDTRWASQVRQEIFSPNPELRYEAARACGELQLAEAVTDLEELVDDADLEIQEAALWALGQIGGDKARTILERYCNAEYEATRVAAEAALAELEFLHGDLSELFDRLEKAPDW